MALGWVAVQDGGGQMRDMSAAEFLAMPLDERVRLVLEQRLHFFDAAGQRLPAGEGLKLLKGLREAAAPTGV